MGKAKTFVPIEEGKVFGELTSTGEEGRMPDGRRGTVCRCSCGNRIIARNDRLFSGRIISCGHYREQNLNIGKPATRDIEKNEVFGYLKVTEPGLHLESGRACRCKCKCGTDIIVRNTDLLNGRRKSCGCMVLEGHEKHGMCHSRLAQIFYAMHARCRAKDGQCFRIYSGRGIRVCDEWSEFEPFRDWALANGYRDDLSIDRIDNNKGYSPDNCRWATALQQARNQRRTVMLTHNGETRPLREWCEITGIPRGRMDRRVRAGMSDAEIFTVNRLKTGKKTTKGK